MSQDFGNPRFRKEHDSLGEVLVPATALYGAQTQRAVDNFPISGERLPRPFLRALAMIKGAAASVNRELGLLDPQIAAAIEAAAREVEEGQHDAQFPIDVYQTGSGTSTNMNANEVIATLANRRTGATVHPAVHPNDHVNMGQSSNDVIPTAIHISAYQETAASLRPALAALEGAISQKARAVDGVVKNGRTHLMDAVPIRMSQEMEGWARQVRDAGERVESTLPRLARLAIGGTAVGTGVNTHPEFGARVAALLAAKSGLPFVTAPNYFACMGGQDTAVELSGQLKSAAVALMKICNDLRWMNSGPVSGLAEIQLPALQPGSSIMPGKVNPVIPEAVAMVCARVIGNDATVTVAGQSGNFQLNVMLPLIAASLLESIQLLSQSCRLLADRAIAGFTVNKERLRALADRNPMLVTALSPIVGYEKSALIVKKAAAEDRGLKDVAAEMTDLSNDELDRLLDPLRMTQL
jgi:fumarate hydratase class II